MLQWRPLHSAGPQAKRDFGAYLASAESEQDLSDRVVLVQRELHQAGVRDSLAVLEALAADSDDDDELDTEDDSTPDYVDTDPKDSKDRDDDKDNKKEAAGPFDAAEHQQGWDEAHMLGGGGTNPAANPELNPQPNAPIGAVPGGTASPHPVVPRGTTPNAGGADQGWGQGAANPSMRPGYQPITTDPTQQQSGGFNQTRTYSRELPVVPRIKK